jgi:glycosyltransferase involved in cell wall biosynthesis
VLIEPLTFLYRKPYPNQYSIEEYFGRVQADLRRLEVASETFVAPVYSAGVLGRLRILWSVMRRSRSLLHITGDITFAALAARSKVVVTIHDCEVLTRLRPIERIIVKALWFDLPVWRADAVTVNSEETARRLRATVPWAKHRTVHVIYVSVANEFKPCPKAFNEQRPIILQVGTKANKNLDRLIEAVAPIDCKLLIIGPLNAAVRQKIERCGIDYENRSNLSVEELVGAFESCDVLVFASTEEGFGMPIVEAQRVGRPVVTSNCSSMPEVAGGAACLVNPFDVESIRDGIVRIIHDAAYRDELVARGFENAQRFDRMRIASRYLEVYRSVLGALPNRCVQEIV